MQSITELQKTKIYTLQTLHTLAQQLQQYQLKDDTARITDKIRQIVSITIWAQKNHFQTFNEFFDQNILDKLFNILVRTRQKDLMISIIQSLSLLMANFQKEEGITRLLHDPSMANFLSIKFNNMTTEVAEYYINFLKSLTTRINQNILPLIYSKKFPAFNLAWQAARFYNHYQLLIRAASRTILLSLMKIKNQSVQKYFSTFPFVIYYSHLMLFVKEYWYKIHELMEERWDAEKEDLMRLPEIVENYTDILLYLEDLMDNGGKEVNRCIVNAICTYLLSDIVYSLKSNRKQQFSTTFCIYMLGVLYKTLKNPLLIEILTALIFGNYSLIKVTTRIQQSRFSFLDSYNKRWTFKNMWDAFDEEFSIYNKYVFDQEDKPLSTKTGRRLSNLGIVTDTLYLFGIVTNPKFNEQVEKLARIYGFSVLFDKKITKYDSITDIYECFRYKLFEAMIDPQQFDENPIKQNILQYLNSKDDHLLMLTLQLYVNMLSNTATSPQILSFCRMNIHECTQQFYTRVSIEKLLTSCCQILVIFPTLRLCTIFNAIKLILTLTKSYESKEKVLNSAMKEMLYNALRISVDVVNLKIANYKNLYTLIGLYQEAEETVDVTKPKQFSIGAYGLVGQNQIISLYQKLTFTDKQQLQKSIHYHFMIRKMIFELFPQQISFFYPHNKFLNNPFSSNPILSFAPEHCIPCRLVENNQAIECYLVLQKYHLIILHPVTNHSPAVQGNLYSQFIYRKISTSQEDSKKITLSVINSSSIVEKSLVLVFESGKRCTEAKERLEGRKETTSSEAIESIKKDLQICLSKAGFLKRDKNQIKEAV